MGGLVAQALALRGNAKVEGTLFHHILVAAGATQGTAGHGGKGGYKAGTTRLHAYQMVPFRPFARAVGMVISRLNNRGRTIHMSVTVKVGAAGVQPIEFANNFPMALMAGTCALEGKDTTYKTAEHLQKVCTKLGIPLVYKGSFDKANRTSIKGERGMGLEEGLKLLESVRNDFGCPVLTDVHETAQVEAVGQVVDIIQIPAFLARQTDLLLACGQAAAKRPGVAVNIKKGQFMAPADMIPAAAKVAGGGTQNILLTERGTTFGYGNLVVDMRSFPIMAGSGYPVIHDASHCVMMPSVRGDSSGGDRTFIAPLARAAVAVGVAGLFLETHPNPAQALSDKETQVPLAELESLLSHLKALDDLAKSQTTRLQAAA